ncbi:MAG: hypothetical protein WA208_13990 [Thermoanaerobaculia bacterium]
MDPFAYDHLMVRRKLFTIIHTDFSLQTPDGTKVLWGRKKGFKLKEDIRIYADEEMTREILSIQARQLIDFSGTYDVVDARDQRKIGALRRKGLRSIFRDEWHLLGPDDVQIGTMQEDSAGMALLRRFLSNLIPQAFNVMIGSSTVAEIRQQFNPFRFRLGIDFTRDPQRQLDRRLGVAAAVLLSMIEGRQSD